MSGDPHPSDDDPLILSIRALKAEVNRWIDGELRARGGPAPPAMALIPGASPVEAPANGEDPRGRLDALAARLEGRLRQGGRPVPTESPAGG
ncbi:MAG: hypothetical protein U0800_01945 [Isosphaeraceae bacterium]